MKTGERISSFEIIVQCLGNIWEPAGAAFKVQADLGVRTLEETSRALERAGYEICPVDLPAKVSGFAQIIADRPHLVLNRAKSRQELQYTIPHELGHLILHLNPVSDPDPLGFSQVCGAELEADLFATSWLLFLPDEKQRNAVIFRNSEVSRTLAIYFFLSVMAALVAVLLNFILRDVQETR